MTDKVQKIREEVIRLRNLHQMKYQQIDVNDNMCLVECGKRNLCNELLLFIDSMQEEPQVKESAEIERDKEMCKENGNSLTLDGVITFDYYEGDKAYGCVAHDSFCLEDLGLKDMDEVKILILKKIMSYD